MADITTLKHPVYKQNAKDWEEYRLTLTGGKPYLEKYLIKRSGEDKTAFKSRKQITPIPAFAKSNLREINNAVRQRLTGVRRVGGSPNYTQAVEGISPGVDRAGSSMSKFIGDEVLSELTGLGGVGIYLDAPLKDGSETLADDLGRFPYCYTYTVENILSWAYDPKSPSRFKSLLLQDTVGKLDEETGLTTDYEKRYRLYTLGDSGGVSIQFYDDDGIPTENATLELDEIPFVYLSLSNSLLADVSSYQRSLLNLGSTNMKYAWEGNTVFLAEQYDLAGDPQAYYKHIVNNQDTEGADTSVEGGIQNNPEKRVIGEERGIRVPKGVDFPKYISPDPGPLKISIELFETLKTQTGEIMNQNLKALTSKASSADSKKLDSRKEEDGLKVIGDTLEYGERELARLWSKYEGTVDKKIDIRYPLVYELKTSKEKLEEAKSITDSAEEIPSQSAKKALFKKAANILLEDSVSKDALEEISSEIDSARGYVSSVEKLFKLVESGSIPPEAAAEMCGFDSKEAALAEASRIERAKEIAKAQAVSTEGAKGVKDLAVNPGKEAKDQKTQAKLEGKTVIKTGPE